MPAKRTELHLVTPMDAQLITDLAALPPLEYDRVRKDTAAKQGVRVDTLDAEVNRTRKNESKDETSIFPDVQPWPSNVDGTALLDALANVFQRYVVLPDHAATALALWVLFTYCIDKLSVAPILALTSPEKRCGKSTLLDALGRLVHRPLASSNITSAALFRVVEAWSPTLLIDEGDTFLRDSDELRGLINSGHTRANAYVVRVVEVSGDFEPRRFTTWGAKVIAMIGKLPDTIEDRSIKIDMQRKLRGQKVEKLRHAPNEVFDRLRSQCARFAEDIVLQRPLIPEALNDRAADNWEPLLAIADAAAGKWPQLARIAAIVLSGDSKEADSIAVQLLSDIKAIFLKRKVDRIASTELIELLSVMEERPWPEFAHGRPLTTRQLAKLLSPFSVMPETIRLGSNVTLKGYTLERFADAFARYLPCSDPSQRHKSQQERIFEQDISVTAPPLLRIGEPLNPATGAACDAVTDRTHQKTMQAASGAIAIPESKDADLFNPQFEVRL